MSGAARLHDRAYQAANRGAFAKALTLLDQATHLTADDDISARIALTRAYVDAETGHDTAAIERCLSLIGAVNTTDQTQGLVWSQLGLLHMRRGEQQNALDAFAHALQLLRQDSPDVAMARLNRGNVFLQIGWPRRAAVDFDESRRVFAHANDVVQSAKAQHNLGYARLLEGELVDALRSMEQAADILASLSPVSKAVGEQDRAEVLLAAGRPREAIAALEEAATAYGSRRLRTYQADCELTLAWTTLREDPARARVIARRAARRFRGQASPARALRADAVAMVAEISAGGRTPAVLRRADALAAELREQGHVQDALLLELQAARVTILRRDLDGARERLKAIHLTASTQVPTRLLWREVRAELAEARGDVRRAHDHVRAGLADLHSWQSSFGSLDLQSTLVGHGRDLARIGLRLAAGTGQPELVYEWSERARALVGRVPSVRPPADEALASDLTELRVLGENGDADRAEELREQVRRHQWYAEGAGAVGEPASLDELRAGLATDDAALVAHLLVADRLHALVVTPDDAATFDLGPADQVRGRIDGALADLAMAAAHRDGPLAAPVRGSLHARLDQLAQQLVAPVLHHIGHRRLVLTPSGVLAGTPWSLLPGLVGTPLTIPPSATRWLELRGAPAPTTVGLVAGPGIARGEEEVRRAAAEWVDARTLVGAEATAEQVARLAERVDVLHLAGHGRHTRENPLFSAVELYDGPWFGYDIDQLARTPDTVVLSACELGRVSVRSGEEAIGMSAAWLHAGARTVLSSPVLIADDVACDAMTHWHALVSDGVAPADALAEAGAKADDVVPMLSFGAGW